MTVTQRECNGIDQLEVHDWTSYGVFEDFYGDGIETLDSSCFYCGLERHSMHTIETGEIENIYTNPNNPEVKERRERVNKAMAGVNFSRFFIS